MSITAFTRRVFIEQRIRFLLALGGAVAASFFEGLGIALLLPLLRMIMAPSGGGDSMGRIGEAFEKLFAFIGIPMNIGSVLVFMVFMVIVKQIVLLLQQKLVFGSQHRFTSRIRDRLYRSIFGARWAFFVQTRPGDMTNALSEEAARCGEAFRVLNLVLSGIVISGFYLALAMLLSWQATLIAGVGSAVVMLIFKRETDKGKTLGAAITEANQAFHGEVVEQLSAAKLIKGYAAQNAVIGRFHKYYENVAHATFRGNFHNARLKAFLETGMGLMLAITIYVAVVVFNINFAKLIVFLLVFYRVGPRLSNVQTNISQLHLLTPALQRIDDLQAEADSLAEKNGGRPLETLASGISFLEVGFSYEPGHPVLKDVSFDIPKGKTVAFVGSSGAGKSTVIDLIIGLIEPDEGRVMLDGAPLSEYDLNAWKAKLGYVAQDTVLFNDTVRTNITWASPDAGMEQIIDAAKLANAHEFIEAMPQGYDTVIGTHGTKLSGGQRQRLALARAILRRPELLILDEATSALDAESEQRIQAAVESLAGEMTIVIVTHRLATVRHADLIYVLEGGRVIERGTWQQMARGQGRFEQLKRLQALD